MSCPYCGGFVSCASIVPFKVEVVGKGADTVVAYFNGNCEDCGKDAVCKIYGELDWGHYIDCKPEGAEEEENQ